MTTTTAAGAHGGPWASALLLAALTCGGCIAAFESEDGAVGTGEIASASSPTPSMLGVLNEREGWGRGATGGAYGSVFHVTNLNNSGPGSLRAGLEDDAAHWIVFDLGGTIELSSTIKLRSNKTVDARGRDVAIRTRDQDVTAFDIIGVENIILINLHFDNDWQYWDEDAEGADAIAIGDSENIWIHHCHFEQWSDGAIDIGLPDDVGVTRRVSVTWSKFVRIYQALRWRGTKLSFGHNFCKEVQRRCIKISDGRAHSYNNFIKDWESSLIQHAEGDGELYAQRNMFDSGSTPDVNKRAEGGKIEIDGYHAFDDLNFAGDSDDVDDSFVADSQANSKLDVCTSQACWSGLRDRIVDGDSAHAAAGDSL